jgi:hypothetical protein
VKRLILHIVLAIVILDTTSLYQVLKFPSLIRHYLEHKSSNQQIGFVEFLGMHYGGDDLDDNDDDKDMQLPFKKIEIQPASFLVLPGSFTTTFTFNNVSWPVESHYGPDKPQVYFNTSLGSLFRPPRA